VNAKVDIAPAPANSVNQARRLRDLMTPASRARYLAWRGLGLPERIVVGLLTGERLVVRRPPAHDLNVAHEVFVQNVYRHEAIADGRGVRRIVDVGSNVGYTLVYFAFRYPKAALVAFEPHPVHVELLRRNVALNDLSSRVQIHAAAAGDRNGEARLSDEGARSALVSGEAREGIPVPLIDFFDTVGGDEIDLLKIDAKGGEFPILMDERFANLRTRVLVVQWHATLDRPDADVLVSARLERLGWRLKEGPQDHGPGWHDGIIWGRH
jgi:FkbM family methyltransferase